jgi:hypothetical protein
MIDEDYVAGRCDFHVTYDSGKTWADGHLPVPKDFADPPCVTFDSGAAPHFNQSVVFGTGQNVYTTFSSHRGIQQLPEGGRVGGEGDSVIVSHSGDGGKTWDTGVVAIQGGAVTWPFIIRPGVALQARAQGDKVYVVGWYVVNPPGQGAAGGAGDRRAVVASSDDGGKTWSPPVMVGPSSGTMSLAEWWIDGDIGIDSSGNLYAVWDTQGSTEDVGWLSYSTDHGAHWSNPVQVPPDRALVPHVMEVAGGGSGIAYVSFFSSADPQGYAEYLRTFSTTRGWLSAPVRISPEFGDASIWPGDTFGISTLAPDRVVLSWGSATATTKKKSEIFVAPVTVQLH